MAHNKMDPEGWDRPDKGVEMTSGLTVLDIETIRADSATRSIMKDQSDVNWAKTPLSTFYGRVFAIGTGTEYMTKGVISRLALRCYYGSDERKVITQGCSAIGRSRLVTWNGKPFDLPFIRNRAIIHRVNVSGELKVPHYDMREYWHGTTEYKPTIVGSVGLNQVAKLLGVGGKTGHGIDVAGMHERGEWDQIAHYCLDDVLLTWKVYHRTLNYEVPVETEVEVTRHLVRCDV